ncbi:alpha/beta-hydrolase [Lophium mytilinum]|uniref:Alpha/beta-hydrolase n=1 Tax=Lophium mytilinum TaxID=390894 RepID=A0A6A6QKU1_9PEZI|nr:alpha/beta-hydrolase [Lophium mytilinum]
MRFSLACVATLFCASTAIAGSTPHGFGAFNKVRSPTIEKREPGQPFHNAKLQKLAAPIDRCPEFAVNGTGIPDVPFDIGESYAGLLPISDDPDETRELFFWFFPSTNPNPGEEITIWFNGGPGCSSLSGLLTENGPFVWDAGTLAPTPNPYTWVNLTNMVWVEQPVGVGFTQGTPNITNEVELGLEFIGFYKQFVETFDVHKWKTNQQQVVQLAYVEYWNKLFYLNETFLEEMREHNEFCNYTQYMDKYLTFPPPQEPFPVLPDPYASEDYTCDQFDNFYAAILAVNPCYNIYHITETCPHPYSVLGIVNTGDYDPPGATVYFNRTDVQKAIHAPVGTNWMQCTDINVFGDGENSNYSRADTSLGPAQNGVLARVIEYTNNTIIGSGNLDMLLNTNGTLLAIQNMTWNGKQGLQEYPGTPLYAPYHPETNGGFPAGAGEIGFWGLERGLTFYQTQLAGHELPQYTPGVAYRMLEILLGRIENFSVVSDFTTQSGNYTGNSTIYRRSMEIPSYFQ